MITTPAEAWINSVAMTALPVPDVPPDELYATHSGELDIPGFGLLRVYQLSDGQRVIDADDLLGILGGDHG